MARTAALFGLFLLATQTTNAQPKRLSLAQAVQAAERFIVVNGYTDLPPTRDTRKLSRESIEWAENTKQTLAGRRHTMERSAYAYAKNRRGGQPGWTIVFRYKGPAFDYKNGRAVTMDPDGGNPRVEHVDAILKAFKKLQRGTERARVRR